VRRDSSDILQTGLIPTNVALRLYMKTHVQIKRQLNSDLIVLQVALLWWLRHRQLVLETARCSVSASLLLLTKSKGTFFAQRLSKITPNFRLRHTPAYLKHNTFQIYISGNLFPNVVYCVIAKLAFDKFVSEIVWHFEGAQTSKETLGLD